MPWTRRVRNSCAAAAWVSSAVSQNHTLHLVWISSPPPSDSLFGHTDVVPGSGKPVWLWESEAQDTERRMEGDRVTAPAMLLYTACETATSSAAGETLSSQGHQSFTLLIETITRAQMS